MAAVLADGVLVVHLGFLAFVGLGGFLAWRWPRWLVAHVAAVSWGAVAVAFSLRCPLTVLEDALRRRAGQPGLGPTGFVDSYIEGVVYPERDAGLVRALVGAVVVVSWWGVLTRRRARLRD